MYNNIPSPSKSPAAVAYSNSYERPTELETNTFNIMKGFFEARGFDKLSAESIAVTFIKQAQMDSYNPLEIIDTLKTFDAPKLNSVVTEVLNYNRFKSSYLGSTKGLQPFEPVSRNIVV